MRKVILTLCFVIYLQAILFGQTEKEVNSTIKKVTVFTQGAQIEREATIDLQQGQMILKLINLSPFINEESIRISGDGSYIIEKVLHQNDYLNELEKNKGIELLRNEIEEIQLNIEDEQTWILILKDKLDFLKTNKQITGKEQTINPETFTSLNSIYGKNLESLNFDLLKKKRTISNYKKDIFKLNSQLNSLNDKSDLPSGTVIITIDSKEIKKSQIKLNYLVENAEWNPSYDIRFLGVNKPLSITFKANIKQKTGIDWEDINLVLSTTKTNISAQMPKLTTNYLQFYFPEIAQALQGRVAGVQIKNDYGAAGASPLIRIRGTSSISADSAPLYIVDGTPVNDIASLDPNSIEEMKVLKDASVTSLYGSRAANGVILVRTKQNNDKSSIPFTITSKQETSNEYFVENKQTILSSNKTNTISFKNTNLDAIFEYQSVPKLAENTYLIAKIGDWYKADLINGNANVYLENSYVGKSFINTKQLKDTLDISFGVDNNISIKREKLLGFTENQIIGSNRKETLTHKLTVRNNKMYSVSTKIIDQIPISTTKDIKVEILEVSNGIYNSDTGRVFWKIDLKPNETKEILIKYSVRYPKDKKVTIE